MANNIKELKVNRHSTKKIHVNFAPDWISESRCKVELYNTITNDCYKFDLRGTGEDPLAEEHFVVKCQAK